MIRICLESDGRQPFEVQLEPTGEVVRVNNGERVEFILINYPAILKFRKDEERSYIYMESGEFSDTKVVHE